MELKVKHKYGVLHYLKSTRFWYVRLINKKRPSKAVGSGLSQSEALEDFMRQIKEDDL